MPKGVFLCYRRDDTAGYAGRLYDRLKARFPHRVFRDVDEIAPGSDYVTAIEKALGGCGAFVVLIGRQWSSEGRLDDSADLVRLEIATALRQGLRVVPVLLRGATMPSADDLPADLAALARRQALTFSDEDWDHDCARLIAALESELGAHRSRLTRLALAAIALVVLPAVTIVVWPRVRPSSPPSGSWTYSPGSKALERASASQESRQEGREHGRETSAAIREDITSGPKPPDSSQMERYFIRAFNCDDGGRAFVNGTLVATVGFGDDSGWVDVTRFLRHGRNSIKFQVINEIGAITYGFQVRRDQAILFNTSCGVHHQYGCEGNRDFPVGVARELSFDLIQP